MKREFLIYSTKKTTRKVLFAIVFFLLVIVMAAPANATTEVSSRVKDIVENMSTEEKICQMMMVDFRKWGDSRSTAVDFTEMNDEVYAIIEEHNFGAVIFFANNIKSTEQSYELVQEVQRAAVNDGGISMILSVDQEGGSVFRLGSGTALPGNMALGATYTSNGIEYSYTTGKIISDELTSLGINTNLAPVVDVNNNPNNPVIGLRSYSDDGGLTGELAAATISGMNDGGLICCAKHFPGHGDTEIDSHYGLPIVNKTLSELKEVELKPYEKIIDNNVDMIMTAHILYPQLESDQYYSDKTEQNEDLPATMSDEILTELLKEDMGFNGIVITDSINMAGISSNWNTLQAMVLAIEAGADMICMPRNLYCKDDVDVLDDLIEGLVQAVEDGELSIERIDDAVTRILMVKEKNGLLDWSDYNYSLEKALEIVGSDKHREIEREMAAAAVTVVKNEENTLPLELKENEKVLFMAPDKGMCSQLLMGWNRAVKEGVVLTDVDVGYYYYSGNDFSNGELSQAIIEKLQWADTLVIVSKVSSLSNEENEQWLIDLPRKVLEYAESKDMTSVVVSCEKPYEVQLYQNADAVMAVYGFKSCSYDPEKVITEELTYLDEAYGPNIVAAVEVAIGTYGAEGKLPLDIPYYDSDANVFTEEIVYEKGYGISYDAVPRAGFVEQPEGGFVSDGNVLSVKWETNFHPVKAYLYSEGSAVSCIELDVNSKNIDVNANDKGYYICAYYGEGEDEYVLSDLFYVKQCSEHLYVEEYIKKPATLFENGTKVFTCGDCGHTKEENIPAIFSVKLLNTKIVYDGFAKDAEIIAVNEEGVVLKEGVDYVIEYSGDRTRVGTYRVKIIFKGEYSGEKWLYFTIVPKAPNSVSAELLSVSGGYDDVKVTWDKSVGASGYDVYYKRVSSSKFIFLKSTKETSIVKKNLRDGVKYIFKIVPYYKYGTSDKQFHINQYKTIGTYTLKRVNTPVVTKSGIKVKVKWNNINGESGYQISKSTKKSGTNIVSTYKTTTGTSKIIRATKGKTYYYKVRAYRVVGDKKVYGPWSYVKSFKRR